MAQKETIEKALDFAQMSDKTTLASIALDLNRIAGVLERLERFFVATSVQDVESAIERLETEGY